MTDYLRLRQICLVARELEPVIADLRAILGLEVCYRDSGVAKYGLVNALLPIGTSFLEVVAPVGPNTAAGRFLDRSGGHGGYMAIFDCGDPERRRRHAEAIGIRIANVIEYAEYLGIQLHPRDCRAAMIELNHTHGGDDPALPRLEARPRVTAHRSRGVARVVERAKHPGANEEPPADVDRGKQQRHLCLDATTGRSVATRVSGQWSVVSGPFTTSCHP